MEMERFQLVLVFLCWMLPFLLKAQDLSACWLGAPYISESSVTPDISVVKMPISATHFNWSIQASVSWQQPTGFEAGTDSYVVSLRKVEDGHTPEDEICAVTGNEIIVDVEAVTFTNLSFGFLYEFKVYPYRAIESKKSLVSTMTAFQTPDCYQATGDEEFCSMVDVRYSGAPLDPHLESICFNETSQFIEVEISWLPPIQVNGILSFFELIVASPSDESVPDGNPFNPPPSLEPPAGFPGGFGSDIGGHQVIVYVPPSYQEGDKITTRLTSLRENELYFVTITPIVSTVESVTSDGEFDQGGNLEPELNPGIEVEMSFPTDISSNGSATGRRLCGVISEMSTTKMFEEPPLYIQPTQTATTPRTLTKDPDGKFEMDGKGPSTAKINSRGSGKTKDTTKAMSRGGAGIMPLPHDQPITPTGIVIVVVATLVVTILIVTTLIVGVHYMRGTAPESPTKLGSMNGSGRTNGKSPDEIGTPLKEHV